MTPFAQLVTCAIPRYAQEMADYFEVAVSTIKRWASGVATPHPLIQSTVVLWIALKIARDPDFYCTG